MEMDRNGNYHFSDFSRVLRRFKTETRFSERQLSEFFGISKTEINRLLNISRLDTEILNASRLWNIEKWVLIDFYNLKNIRMDKKLKIRKSILSGRVRTRKELRDLK